MRRQHWFIGWAIAGLAAMVGVLASLEWVSGPCGGWQEDGLMQRAREERLSALLGKEVIEAAKALDPERMRATLLDLQRFGERSSQENQTAASEYLIERLKSMGLQPEIREYPYEGHSFRNLVVSFPGQSHPERTLLVVAHFDSKNWVRGAPCPGADDNASGVSVLLELARVFQKIPRRCTWQLAFFSNEERGRLGSQDFVRIARQEKKEIAGVIAVDVVGYRQPGISEFFRLAKSSLAAERKIKGIAKIFINAYHALRNACTPLQMAFRSEDLFLAPSPSVRESMGGALFWNLGKACP